MAINATQNGVNGEQAIERNGTLPGETFPTKINHERPSHPNKPIVTDGPIINGRLTAVTQYEPYQLVGSPLLAPLRRLVNKAFSVSHAQTGGVVLPANIDRLRSEDEFLQNMGTDPGTFNYMITYAGTDEIIGTVGAHRYVVPVLEAVAGGGREGQRSTFARVKAPVGGDGKAEMWELKLMATDVSLQRQGLASYMMALTEAEVKRRFKAEALANGGSEEQVRLVMVLTTIKELNEAFYLRRGYVFDYETVHERGFMGSETGFTVNHMSKVLDA